MTKQAKNKGLVNRVFRKVKEESCIATLLFDGKGNRKKGFGISLITLSGLRIDAYLSDMIQEGNDVGIGAGKILIHQVTD